MPSHEYIRTRPEDVEPIENPASFRRGMKLYTRLNVLLYKWSGGRLMRTAMGGFPICLVTLTGHRTGRRLEIPLMHVADGEDKLLVGSQGGLDRDPIWVRSVDVNPDLTIRAAGRTRRYRARRLDPQEKREAWPTLVAAYPPYDEYQARTDRDIPVFRCRPID